MKDTWWNHNTDKVLLFFLVLGMGALILHLVHHDNTDMKSLDWAQDTFATILGALLLLLTGRVSRADGQTANGLPPAPTPGAAAPTPTPEIEKQ